MKSLNIFSRESWCLDSRLPDLIGFDVVVDTLESPKAFKKFVRLIRVMEMRKTFPFDMEALQGLLNKERRKNSKINVPDFQTRDLQDRPLYLPLESGQVQLLFHLLLDMFGWGQRSNRYHLAPVLQTFQSPGCHQRNWGL